jgi:putative ABC transport system permease protein
MKWQRLPRIGDADVPEEVRAEVESHLALQVADLMEDGWSAEAAEAEARRRFGQRTEIEREMAAISTLRERDHRRAQWWDALLQDGHYALRLLRRSPGFTLIVILTLALGIGANTAVFSAVDAALLRPLPYDAAGEVVAVWSRYVAESGEEHEWMSLSAPELRDYSAAARSMSGVAAYTTGQTSISSGSGAADRVAIAYGAANLFDVLRVQPSVGRTFAAGDDGAGARCVVVLSHGLARDRFVTASAAIGGTLRLDGDTCEVIGVMPAGFFFPNANIQLWRPLSIAAEPVLAESRGSHWLRAVARLEHGTTLAQAEAELGPWPWMRACWRSPPLFPS